ncbi:MAG: hypothetical protein ACXADW_22110 [Candidatus Hodarchaeales archaeon]|jgi:hypothetical protein
MNKADKIVLIVYFTVGAIFWGILIGFIIITMNLPPSPIESDALIGPVIILFFWVLEGICIIPKILKRHIIQKKNLLRDSI